jgi:hypothetical protein
MAMESATAMLMGKHSKPVAIGDWNAGDESGGN